MGFIDEAEIMLQHAREASGTGRKAERVGWLTLAKDTVSAAITEAKKGVKSHDGHIAGQMDIDDAKPKGRARKTVKASENGVVTTPADEAPLAPAEPSDPAWNDLGTAPELPDEQAYDALEEHKRHWAETPGIYSEDCVYCATIASGGELPTAHDRPDHDEEIPRINDSRPIPDGQGAQVTPSAPATV